MKTLRANFIDIEQREIYPAEIRINKDRIETITRIDEKQAVYILPGFIDAHVHIESAMLTPAAFAEKAVKHGTIATISDPHEIANVLGLEGVQFMLDNAETTSFYFYFGAPSCVPATSFENSGATLGLTEIEYLLDDDRIVYLAEMMNFPAVIANDPLVMDKINAAKARNKIIDGHAPGLRGEAAKSYFGAGITTDHECFSYEEGMEKAELGVNILIREGSAAKNFDALIPLIKAFPKQIMFCSDDKHPDDLLDGHINQIVVRAIKAGYDFYDVLSAACLNPKLHYGLDTGALKPGDPADFIVVNDIEEFEICETYIKGVNVYGQTFEKGDNPLQINNFSCEHITLASIKVAKKGDELLVIEALDGELITNKKYHRIPGNSTYVNSMPDQDILKIVVLNRYQKAPPAVAFISGFNLKHGAIASTVAHDSHNIIAVGCSDEEIVSCINKLIDLKGGVIAARGSDSAELPLPIAGLMSDDSCETVGNKYKEVDAFSKEVLGSTLKAPFMTLSFMALLVIPSLKLSDLGLFDGNEFTFTSLFR